MNRFRGGYDIVATSIEVGIFGGGGGLDVVLEGAITFVRDDLLALIVFRLGFKGDFDGFDGGLGCEEPDLVDCH